MTFNQIEKRLHIAINLLRIKDFYLLKHDVCERSITHKLAEYLQYAIGNSLTVDCEYNRNIEHPSNSKKIYTIGEEINKYRDSGNEIDDLLELSIFPDIIVHKRGTNKKNTLAIEVKKSTSNKSTSYDFEKLKCYTDNHSENNELKYEFGVFIKFITNTKRYIEPEIIWFRDGEVYHPNT